MSIKIILDSGSDIPTKWIDENIMRLVPLTIVDEGNSKEYRDYYDITKEELYNNMKTGTVYKTSQPSPDSFLKIFREELDLGNEIICLALSSGISGTYQSASMAKSILDGEGLGEQLHIYDTKAASGGVSLIALKIQNYIDRGQSIEKVQELVEFLINNINHLFCAEDLIYLYRGGRISRATKMITNVLDIKPAMFINKENGKLESYDKARGETKVYRLLVKTMKEKSSIENLQNQRIYIYHSDSYDKAEKIKGMIEKEIGATDFFISEIGCTIGAHTGPGTIAIFYLTENGDYGVEKI